LWGCGSLFVLYTTLLYLAVGAAGTRQQVLEIGILNYLWPALTIVLSLFLLDHHACWGLVPGTLLSVLGVVMVITQSEPFP
jgi:drug/metabolite transporter (DMT)-like permease